MCPQTAFFPWGRKGTGLTDQEVDFPPVWLAGFAAVAWGIGRAVPVYIPWHGYIGGVLALIAVIMMAAAALQMMLSGTTVIPGREPRRMVTGGLFRISRNPIYLADAILLTGLCLVWNAIVALPLVPVFMILITKRFIKPEEARLARRYGADFAAYKNRTRRWI